MRLYKSTPSTTTTLSGVEDAVETQNIASLQIDAINDHNIVRCRDAIFCVSSTTFSTTPSATTALSGVERRNILRLIGDTIGDIFDDAIDKITTQ
ncbi:MAG: hypothetical protein LBF59_01505 [Prevotellaceae bacterium]|nr:hypothetical protein [Prevotellaceae bacterium]